jgi:hypothetical protein
MSDSPSPALQIALAYYQAWTSHDLDRAMTYIAADIVCDAPAGRIEGALHRERLQVAACHRADMGGDDLDHPEQGGYQKCNPGQLVTSGSAHGGGRTDVGRVIVGGPGDQLGTNAAQHPPDPVSPSYPQAQRWRFCLAV